MTRRGKIAKLPAGIREQLNRRIEDGVCGQRVLAWLNELPETRALLADAFDGEPVNDSNLTLWKQGAYRDWERQREGRAMMEWVKEDANDLDDLSDDAPPLAERLSMVMLPLLARGVRELRDDTGDADKRWRRVRELLQELARLRREERRDEQLMWQREEQEREAMRRLDDEEEREVEEARNRATAPIVARMKAEAMKELLGGGKAGQRIAEALMEACHELPKGSIAESSKFQAPSSKQAGKSKVPVLRSEASEGRQGPRSKVRKGKPEEKGPKPEVADEGPETVAPTVGPNTVAAEDRHGSVGQGDGAESCVCESAEGSPLVETTSEPAAATAAQRVSEGDGAQPAVDEPRAELGTESG